MLNQEWYISGSAKRAHTFITQELLLTYISTFKGVIDRLTSIHQHEAGLYMCSSPNPLTWDCKALK